MLAKRLKWRRFKEPPPSLVPPDIEKFGSLGFLPGDRSRLSTWLTEADWPRDTMNVVAIEGYLVAMIIWPVHVSPGAWLPAIWGIRGWKVAAKIEAPASYDRFLRLILGYRQHLIHVLNTAPLSFVSALHDSVAGWQVPMPRCAGPRASWRRCSKDPQAWIIVRPNPFLP